MTTWRPRLDRERARARRRPARRRSPRSRPRRRARRSAPAASSVSQVVPPRSASSALRAPSAASGQPAPQQPLAHERRREVGDADRRGRRACAAPARGRASANTPPPTTATPIGRRRPRAPRAVPAASAPARAHHAGPPAGDRCRARAPARARRYLSVAGELAVDRGSARDLRPREPVLGRHEPPDAGEQDHRPDEHRRVVDDAVVEREARPCRGCPRARTAPTCRGR